MQLKHFCRDVDCNIRNGWKSQVHHLPWNGNFQLAIAFSPFLLNFLHLRQYTYIFLRRKQFPVWNRLPVNVKDSLFKRRVLISSRCSQSPVFYDCLTPFFKSVQHCVYFSVGNCGISHSCHNAFDLLPESVLKYKVVCVFVPSDLLESDKINQTVMKLEYCIYTCLDEGAFSMCCV